MKYKLCNRCNSEKEETEFTVKQDNASKKHGTCKQCLNTWQKQYRENNPEKVKNSRIQRAFGLSLSAFNKMLAEQNGVCKICDKPEKEGRALAIDHCHTTKKIRGLLCKECNLGLGKFKDEMTIVEKALNYLKENQ